MIQLADAPTSPEQKASPPRLRAFFLVSRAEHARMWRRISHLSPRLAASSVAAFERVGYPVNHSHSYRSLGRIRHGRFLSRIPHYLRALRTCLAPVAVADVCYAFSLDALFMLVVFRAATGSRARLVYEVADIHPVLSRAGMRGSICRWFERTLVKRCSAVVVTSPAFVDDYFSRIQRMPALPSVVIEHKVSLPAATRDRISFRRAKPAVLVIGYVGLMKSPASFDLLVRLAERAGGRIEVRFHGVFNRPLDEAECRRRIAACPWLSYAGPYQSPQDLESIYTGVDMVWDAYFEGDNARWQRTTRFSEACYFKRPLLYHPATQDGRLAERHGLGLPVSFDDPAATIDRIQQVTEPDLRRWFAAFERLPAALLFYDREYDHLLQLLSSPAQS